MMIRLEHDDHVCRAARGKFGTLAAMPTPQSYRRRSAYFLALILSCLLVANPPSAAAAAGTAPTNTVATNTAKVPRTRSGKPDLSGIWQTLDTAEWNLEPHSASNDGPAGLGVVEGEVIPYQPWALEQRKENYAQRQSRDPNNKCYMPGVPRLTYTPLPFQIFQSDQELTLLYQYAHSVRTIHANGTPHPSGHIDWWLGDSRGHWDKDTLIVDVTDFNDQTWFDRAGNFHSDELHVIERYRLLDADHIDYQATIEDPKVFTRPWNIRLILYRHKETDFQLLEHECYTFDFEKFYP